MTSLAALTDHLHSESLRVMGSFALADDDGFGDYQTLALIGPDEPGFWLHFTASAEYNDGKLDPLDRWSRRVLPTVAQPLGAAVRFPFGGPPYDPFYSWALRTGRFWASPIGFLVHDTAGLFASFRGALLLPFAIKATSASKPCATCADQPCATACPVNAFADGYDVAACKGHLNSDAGRNCVTAGCLARRACPVGASRRLPAQSAFHMKAFR